MIYRLLGGPYFLIMSGTFNGLPDGNTYLQGTAQILTIFIVQTRMITGAVQNFIIHQLLLVDTIDYFDGNPITFYIFIKYVT